MPPFWGVLLWRQRRRRRDAEAPLGLGLSSEAAAAAAAEAQAAAEAAAGSGAAAGECGGHGLTGRGWEGGKGGRREAPRGGSGPGGRGSQGPSGAAAPGSPRPGAGRRSLPACRGPPLPGSGRACPARAPAPRETRPLRGLVPSPPRPLPSPCGPRGLHSPPRDSSVLFSARRARPRLSARDTPSLPLSPHVFLVPTPGEGQDPCFWGRQAVLLKSLESPRFPAPDPLGPWLALPPTSGAHPVVA